MCCRPSPQVTRYCVKHMANRIKVRTAANPLFPIMFSEKFLKMVNFSLNFQGVSFGK